MKQQLLRLRTLVAVMMCALMGAAFTACSDDDDAPDVANIEGKWVCIESDATDDRDTQMIFRVGESITLMSGNRLMLDDDTEEDNVDDDGWYGYRWSLEGKTLYLMEEDKNDDHSVGTISINGNEMTYKYVYKNWHGSDRYWEDDEGPFVAKFKKVQ